MNFVLVHLRDIFQRECRILKCVNKALFENELQHISLSKMENCKMQIVTTKEGEGFGAKTESSDMTVSMHN